MSTATKDPAHAKTGPKEIPQPLDPEHDIDAKSATWWVLGGAIVLFASLWVMLPIFIRVQEEEQRRKVGERPNVELQDLRAAQDKFLAGDNPKKKSIDQAMADALKH